MKKMQAISDPSSMGGDGQFYTWLATSPDFTGTGFPGPGTPIEIAVTDGPVAGGSGGGSGGHAIEVSGKAMSQRAALAFTAGAGIALVGTDDADNGVTRITIGTNLSPVDGLNNGLMTPAMLAALAAAAPSGDSGAIQFSNGSGGFSSYSELKFTGLGLSTLGLRVTGPLELTGVITPPALSATADNWNPAGLDTASIIIATTISGYKIVTGLAAPASRRVILLFNANTMDTIMLANESSSSDAANRFLCPRGLNVEVMPSTGVLLFRDTSASRWRILNPSLMTGGGLDFNAVGSFGIRREALTGDVTATIGSNATTLAAISGEPPHTERASITAPGSGKGKYWVRADTTDAIQRPVFTNEDGRAEVLAPFPTHRRALQTTDATTTTAITYTMADNSLISIRARFIGRQASSTNTLLRVVDIAYKRVSGGAATLIGAAVEGPQGKDDATWATVIDTSTNDVRLRVTGKATTTINWEVEAWIQERPLP